MRDLLVSKPLDRQTECWSYPRMSRFDDEADRSAYFSYLDQDVSDDEPLRLYIHIPYCKQFCVFCPYYKQAYGGSDRHEKLTVFNAIRREIEYYAAKAQIAQRKLATVYFGGGDPALISIEEHEVIWKALRDNFDWANDADVTVEGTALSFLDREKLEYLKSKGVSRVSYGIQTFDEAARPQLNLEPTVEQLYQAALNIRKSGIQDFGVDIMYNLPGQTDDKLAVDLQAVQQIGATYIDFYALNLYPNTVYYKKVREGAYGTRPTTEAEIRMWREIMRVMAATGHGQVSSVTFSKTRSRPHLGFEHTLRGYPMLGIGPSSRSMIQGRNHRNHASNEQYVKALENGQPPVEATSRYSWEETENAPFVYFPIRLRMDWDDVVRSPRNYAIMKSLIEAGYVEKRGDEAVLTSEGRVWPGNVQRAFFSDDEHDKERRALFDALKTRQNPYNQDFMGVASQLRDGVRVHA